MTLVDHFTLPRLAADLDRRGLVDLMPFWQMPSAERISMVSTLAGLDIDCAIEIGTAQGGSLAAITSFAKLTYSLELLPESSERLRSRMTNADFRVGDSRKLIPVVLREIRDAGRDLDFVLVDGDHSRAGVRADIEAVLQWIPRRPMAILMHDSFNPDCRFGMKDVRWADHRHVHAVDLDFVGGNTISRPDGRFEMWAGLALALLLPDERRGPLSIDERCGALFQQTLPFSVHASVDVRGTEPWQDHQPATLSPNWYQLFSNVDEERLHALLTTAQSTTGQDPLDFTPIRTRLAPRVAEWRARGSRVAIYGAGTHTMSLLGLMPEIYPLVHCFVDQQGTGSFLGRPRLSPSAFSSDVAEIVLYSSAAHEATMFGSLASHPVEHVRLYA